MKTLYILGFIIFISDLCIAQTILPVEELNNYSSALGGPGYPNHTEFRDVNDSFHPYLGVWEATYIPEGFSNSVHFEVHVSEFIDDRFTNGKIIERLVLHYKIYDNTFMHLDTTNLPNEDGLVNKGRFFYIRSTDGATVYMFNYTGENINCGQEGNIYINLIENNGDIGGQMRFKYTVRRTSGSGMLRSLLCEDGFADQILPTEPIILIRQ